MCQFVDIRKASKLANEKDNNIYKILPKFKDRFALFDFRFAGNIFIAMAQIG